VGVWNDKTDHMQTRSLELWIGLVEFRPFNREAYGDAGAFSYIVTWARDAAEFRKKADTIATTMGLYVMGIEREKPLAKWLETQSPLGGNRRYDPACGVEPECDCVWNLPSISRRSGVNSIGVPSVSAVWPTYQTVVTSH
jgi:hypothetical protein